MKQINGKLNKHSLADQIVSILRKRIIDQEFKSGEKINISELQSEFSISSAPVREALCLLAQEKIINIIPRVGYFVKKLGYTDIKELFDIRKLFKHTHYMMEQKI